MNKIIDILKEKKSIPLDQFINIALYDKKIGFYNWPKTNQECGFSIIIKGQTPVPWEGSHFNLTTDKHKKIWLSAQISSASNIRDDMEEGQYIELTYKPNSHITFSTSYDRYRLKKQYHWTNL